MAVLCCTVLFYAGKPLVLFFYPKAATPGCTKEVGDQQGTQ
jgi:peroxiredoxin